MNLRTLVVDDSALYRKLVSQILASVPGVEVVGTATNGRQALERVRALQPDLLTLDVEMPEMNGIEVLDALAAAKLDTGVIVVSGLTEQGGRMTVKALERGAFDFLTKPQSALPSTDADNLSVALAAKVKAFGRRHEIRRHLRDGRSLVNPVKRAEPASAPQSGSQNNRINAPPLVLIGVSTGGPAALGEVLPVLHREFAAPVLIVQHMPPLFTGQLAKSLAAKCHIDVAEAKDGEVTQAGCAYVAPGGSHMKIAQGRNGQAVIRLDDGPPENQCKPSVDVLFRSAAEHFPRRSIAAVLTGMGCDGTAGLKLLKRQGCIALAQDEKTSTVFGMPREAIEAGVIDFVLPLQQIGAALIRHVGEAR